MEWTDEIISRLQTLWQEGLSTAEIGRQLSITKNAVVGKAHRLGLPPRPSPIRATAKPRKEVAAETPVSQDADETAGVASAAPQAATPGEAKISVAAAPAAPVKSVAAEPVAPPAPKTEPVEKSAASPISAVPDEGASVASKPSPTRKPAEAKTMSPDLMLRPLLRPLTTETSPRRGPACCWPNGDPGTPGFHFCGAKPVPGKPYCAEHCAIAYVKLRDRRESVG
ncbi:GcrA family cell cycle regulator [Asaia platycodi]|uniref:GcrA family cell cycle regulator n=1 Tax=Asaia platycodi TaxID=610243 RepID=UPI00046E8B60|nr:GcrA family cell cycle regulator [Asaia platycodi]